MPSIILLVAICFLIIGTVYDLFFYFGVVILLIITIFEWLFVLIFDKGYLNISTPDGTNEPLHPSIVYFRRGKWNNYKYWMAFTPYPIKSDLYRDRYECPCVVASNDGIKWTYPDKKEYLDDLTELQINEKDYFSDTELVFNKDLNKLYLYYRLSTGEENNKNVELFRKETDDGINWSERESISFDFMLQNDLQLVSPSIIFKDSRYYLWFVSGNKDSRRIYQVSSIDGINWQNVKECAINGFDYDPWHIDCNYINGKYVLIVYDQNEHISILLSNDGLNFDFDNVAIVPNKHIYSYYRSTLYRASICYNEDKYYLYFTAGNDRKNSIGLLTGKTLSSLSVEKIPIGVYRFSDIFKGWTEKYLLPFKIILNKISNLF